MADLERKKRGDLKRKRKKSKKRGGNVLLVSQRLGLGLETGPIRINEGANTEIIFNKGPRGEKGPFSFTEKREREEGVLEGCSKKWYGAGFIGSYYEEDFLMSDTPTSWE